MYIEFQYILRGSNWIIARLYLHVWFHIELLNFYNIQKMCLVSVSTFYFLSSQIIFLTFFIHRFCSVFFIHFLDSLQGCRSHAQCCRLFLFCIYQKVRSNTFFLSFDGSLNKPFSISINCVFLTHTVYRRFVYGQNL